MRSLSPLFAALLAVVLSLFPGPARAVEPASLQAPREVAVGAILPLSGRFATAGNYVLDGIRAAIRLRERSGRLPVRLEVRDSAGDPARAVAALEELAALPEVVGVVGPLLSSVAPEVARRAEELSIPLVSFSQREDLPRAGPHVFSSTVSSADQVQALLDWAMGTRGFKRFAILYPDGPLGGEMAALFRSRVLERGGSIAAIAAYDEAETDFRPAVRRLLGTEYRKRGVGEADRVLPRLPGVVPPQLDGGVKVLTPGMDFDAVFVPDSYRRVSMIAPALVYEEVDLGDTFGREKPDVRLLAPAAAHHPDLVRLGGRYLIGTVVCDAVHMDDPREEVERFRAAFAEQADRSPGLLEALAYDSVRAVIAAVDAGGPIREGVRRALTLLERFEGVTGTTGFGPNRKARRTLYVLEATADGFRKLAPPYGPAGEE